MKESSSERRFSRRNILTGAAVAGAAVAAGVLESKLDTDWEDLKTLEDKVQHFRFRPNGFEGDKAFKERAATPVAGREQFTRAEYAHHAFGTLPMKNLPEGVRKKLAALAPGIPAQETRYNNNLTSESGAKYIWQFTPSAIQELNQRRETGEKELTLEDTKSMQVGTLAAFRYFDRGIYPVVLKAAQKCAERFGIVGAEEQEKFLTLCMVNAYNTGPTRMRRVLEKFTEAQSPKQIRAAYNYDAPSLFNAVAERAVRDKYERGYGRDSSQYVFAVLAGAESLHAQYALDKGTTFAESFRRSGLKTKDFVVEEILEPSASGAAAAAATYGVSRAIGGEQGPVLSRRNLIAGALAAGLGVAGSQAEQGNIKLPRPDLWWQRAEAPREAPRSEVLRTLADGTKYDPRGVDAKLTAWYQKNDKRLFGNLQPAETIRAYAAQRKNLERRRRNFTREGVPKLMRTLSEKGVIHRFSNLEEVEGILGKQFLTPVEEVNGFWRTRSIGSGAVSTPQNDLRYARLTPGSERVLRSIGERFQGKLREAGLAEEWDARFIVSSLLRTHEGTNRSLGGAASAVSPHTFGMGFDISNTRFDLIHKADKTFLMFGATSANAAPQSPRHVSILNTLNHLLIRVLEDAHAEGEIALTFEPERVHYHITSRTP